MLDPTSNGSLSRGNSLLASKSGGTLAPRLVVVGVRCRQCENGAYPGYLALISSPIGQWSEPMTSGRMKESFTFAMRFSVMKK